MRRDQRGAAGVRFAIVFVVLAAVLAAVFYGGDAYARGRVQREAATQLQAQLGTPAPPVVTIGGRPFLTQVVARKIGVVHVVADDLGQTTNAPLRVSHADMTLRDVTTTDWWKTMNAASVEGDALVGYDELRQAAGVPLAYAGNGRFSIDVDQSLAGFTIKAKITGRLALDVDRQTVSLADPTVEVSGYTLPDVVAEQLIKAVVQPIPLEGIPLDLRVGSIDPQDDALHVRLSGTDVPLTR